MRTIVTFGRYSSSRGGTPPLGYDVDPETHKYIINEEEARIVRIIFEKYAHDVGYNQILSYLNRMGYRTKRGQPFGRNSLYSILQNEKYVGKYIFNRKQEKGTSGKRNPTLKPKEEWIVIDDGVPAIVDQQTFDIVQFKIKGNREKARMYRAREIYLLLGLIICGECGESMYGNTRFADGIKAVIPHIVAQQERINEAVKIKKFGVNTSRAMYLMNFMNVCSRIIQSRS